MDGNGEQGWKGEGERLRRGLERGRGTGELPILRQANLLYSYDCASAIGRLIIKDIQYTARLVLQVSI